MFLFSVVSFILIFINCSYTILLKEILLKYIFLNDQKSKISHYFFSNSTSLYRPLWTYYINKKKSKYYFYFYSIASLPVNKSNLNDKKKFYKYFRSNFYGKVFKLEELLFWNKFQKNFYKETILDNKGITYEYIDPICDFGKDANINSKKTILGVFDISPFRTSYYAKRNAPIMTHEDNILKFYDDILNLKYEHDLHLVIKLKD